MIGGEERSPSRRFLHRESWNRPAPVRTADDRPRAKSRKSEKKARSG